MNGYSAFANSPAAGYLVTAAVLCFTFALLGAIWTVEKWVKARRDSRARELRLQRARRQFPVAPATGPSGNHPQPLAFRRRTGVAQSEADRRIKAIGVTEEFHAWAREK